MIRSVSPMAMPNPDLPTIQPGRFCLWIDAVGGYLVCPSSELLVGQAISDSRVDIPVVGDVARRHVRLKRMADLFVVEPLAETRIDGRTVSEPTPLYEGNELQLTGGVRMRFQKPHPLSMTATLLMASRHRTRPWSDGILWMAESCVIGPSPKSHIVCGDWHSELVLFRRGGELHARCQRPFTVDGEPIEGSCLLPADARVVGEDFSMSLESVPI